MSETNFRLHVVNCKCAGFYTDPRCRSKTMTDTDKPDAGEKVVIDPLAAFSDEVRLWPIKNSKSVPIEREICEAVITQLSAAANVLESATHIQLGEYRLFYTKFHQEWIVGYTKDGLSTQKGGFKTIEQAFAFIKSNGGKDGE